jgi:hypothetical protein
MPGGKEKSSSKEERNYNKPRGYIHFWIAMDCGSGSLWSAGACSSNAEASFRTP